MQRFWLPFLLLLLGISPAFAQKRRVAPKTPPKKVLTKAKVSPPTVSPVMTEVPEKDWDALTEILNKEDWTQATNLSAQWIAKLKSGSDDKNQLAQLRYFLLYALAGKVNEGKATYAELEKTARSFIGAQFMMPNRTILADCTGKINYICASKNNEQVLRVTATDKVANIHLLEYVKLAENFDTSANNDKSASLIGNLATVETYSDKAKTKILRLIFSNGVITVIS